MYCNRGNSKHFFVALKIATRSKSGFRHGTLSVQQIMVRNSSISMKYIRNKHMLKYHNLFPLLGHERKQSAVSGLFLLCEYPCMWQDEHDNFYAAI